MPDAKVTQKNFPVLVVAYDDKARAALAACLGTFAVTAILCTSFGEAENYAQSHRCRGVLVDLIAAMMAKDEERMSAHTLTALYPALRVKMIGSMLIPMIMAGDPPQEKSLRDFLTRTCAQFTPRRLRSGKREIICVPTLIGAELGFTVNMSWNGAFIADTAPERFRVGDELTVKFQVEPGAEFASEVTVVRIQAWGEYRPPGIGVQFKQLEADLPPLFRCQKDSGQQRLAA
jgi:hypothetical protein